MGTIPAQAGLSAVEPAVEAQLDASEAGTAAQSVETSSPTSLPPAFLEALMAFRKDCERRYRFNSRWDNGLNITGIAVSVLIVACGVMKWSATSAMLGALVAAIVTAQRAFPFTQRGQFYRNLLGQTQNLLLDAQLGTIKLQKALEVMKSLRLDFAQQLPRGNSFQSDSSANPPASAHAE